jgi:hypothetical protein
LRSHLLVFLLMHMEMIFLRILMLLLRMLRLYVVCKQCQQLLLRHRRRHRHRRHHHRHRHRRRHRRHHLYLHPRRKSFC